MTVLVAYASRYGATRQLAGRVGAVLTVCGEEVRVRPVSAVRDVGEHEAVVLGAATYGGAWMPEAAQFLARHRAALGERPVWLFASGPLAAGDPTDVEPEAPELVRLAEGVGARDARRFPGALDPRRLTVPDRLRRLRAGRSRLPGGDFRDWDAVDAWARGIALDLQATRCG